MSRSHPSSRIALILRRLRGRFGISAPKVAVRTHVPWYLRILGIAGIIVLSVALAAWAYDVGRRMSGTHEGDADRVVSELRLANSTLESETVRLRSLLTASESGLQIERAAQKLLSEKSNALADDNARLKEELAVFERLAKLEGKTEDEISIENLSVRADAAPGRYRFNFLMALRGTRRGKDAKFSLQLVVSPRAGTVGAKMTLPRNGDPDAAQYEIALRNFRRIEGKFDVPAGYIVGATEIKIFEAGILRSSRSLVL